MAAKPEQLPSDTKSSFRKARKYIKRVTSKSARRAAKVLLEDAPARRTKGWSN